MYHNRNKCNPEISYDIKMYSPKCSQNVNVYLVEILPYLDLDDKC